MQFGRSKFKQRPSLSPLNMSSMIDVTFLLLIYFIVTTVFTPPEDQLTPALKVEDGSSMIQQDLEPQIVQVELIDQNPAYTIGGHVCLDRKALSKVLQNLPTDPGLIIKVRSDIPIGFAVAAIQVARDANFKKVTYVPE